MNKPVIFMFSGQGSQYYHMGKELFEQQVIFRQELLVLDEIAKALIGESIVDKLYDKSKRKSELFERILYSHPAIFMVEYALAQFVMAQGIEPDYVLGTSMGEFAAASVAGVISKESALEALVKQAQTFESHCAAGGMLAVLDNAERYRETAIFQENCELAAINYHAHFVVSGKNENLTNIARFLKEQEVNSLALPVSYAFHSSLIDPAAVEYNEYLAGKIYRQPEIPFISCAQAAVLPSLEKHHFWTVVRRPIEFQKTIKRLEGEGAYTYLDLGPAGTLANFVKYNLSPNSESKNFAVMSPFGQDLLNMSKAAEYLQRSVK